MWKKEKDSWGLVPKPFNPLYNPKAKIAHKMAIDEMIKENVYDNSSREQCAVIFKIKYDIFIIELEKS